jgi:hypothetical protein
LLLQPPSRFRGIHVLAIKVASTDVPVLSCLEPKLFGLEPERSALEEKLSGIKAEGRRLQAAQGDPKPGTIFLGETPMRPKRLRQDTKVEEQAFKG